MSSFRARLLISSFVITVISTFILGVLLVGFVSKQELENEHENLRNIAFDLMGYFNDDGRFRIQDENAKDLEDFFEKNGFRESSTGLVAYIQNTDTQIVRWSSLDSGLDLTAGALNKLELTPDTYDIRALPNEKLIKRLMPNRQGSMNTNREDTDKKQIVFSMGFDSINNTHYQLVIAKAGQSVMSDPETYYMLILLFTLFIMLVLLAQLAASWWIVSPLKTLNKK